MYSICPYIYHKLKPNVGKYTSPKDPMGNKFKEFLEVFSCPNPSTSALCYKTRGYGVIHHGSQAKIDGCLGPM